MQCLYDYKNKLVAYLQSIYSYPNANRKFTNLFIRWFFASINSIDQASGTYFPTVSIVPLVDIEYKIKNGSFKLSKEAIMTRLNTIHMKHKQNAATKNTIHQHNNITYALPLSQSQLQRFNRLTADNVQHRQRVLYELRSIYGIIGGFGNHLGVPPIFNVAQDVQLIELYGSPFNTYSDSYCSPFDIEKQYCKSLGTSFAYLDSLTTMMSDDASKLIVVNPPFDETIFVSITTKLLEILPNCYEDITVVVVLPAWDTLVQQQHNLRDYQTPCLAYRMLKNNAFFKKEIYLPRDNFKYYNYYSGNKMVATNSVMLVLSTSLSDNYKKTVDIKESLQAWSNWSSCS